VLGSSFYSTLISAVTSLW